LVAYGDISNGARQGSFTSIVKLKTMFATAERQRQAPCQAMMRKPSISHDKAIVRELRVDPKLAAEYLKAAIEDTDEPQVLLIALRHLAEARGGTAKIAKAAGVERESLYRALSPHGNRSGASPEIVQMNFAVRFGAA
jgi:probable addiction module antidote protein